MSSIISRSPSSVPDEFIFSMTDDNGVPVTADMTVWRANVGDVTEALAITQAGAGGVN